MYDLVIIGSGPAGLSAAVYAKRACLDVVVLEKEPMGGGQMIYTQEVDNYLGLPETNGFDLAQKFEQHAKALEVPFISDEVDNVEKNTDGTWKITGASGTVYETKTVLLATGAGHRKLGVPGEETLAGAGVSYCATCDGAFSVTRQWRLSAVEMWHWKMPCIWQPDVKSVSDSPQTGTAWHEGTAGTGGK